MATGITIANMMPVALNRICRSARAIGPLGSSTPSQPPSVAAASRSTVSERYRISSLPNLAGASTVHSAWLSRSRRRRACLVVMRRTHRRGRTAVVIDEQAGKQQEQIGDGEDEQFVRRATIGCSTPVQLKCQQEKERPADGDDRAIDNASKAQAQGQFRSENKQAAVDQDLPRRC